jgi:hypothetical protein
VHATNGDHLFEVRAKDAGGNVDQTPAKRSWRVNSLDDDADGINRPQDCNDANAAIHPGAVDVPDNGVDENCDGADSTDLDRDRDGASRPLDCNDGNAAIRPGAVDVPGDGIDQDCKDGDAAFPVVKASVRWVWAVLGGLTRATRFRVSDLAPGSVVKVSCKGRGCPFKSKQGKPSAKGVVDVKKLLKGRKLKTGNMFEVRISAPGTITKVITFRMRKGKLPTGGKVTCQAPGAAKPTAC